MFRHDKIALIGVILIITIGSIFLVRESVIVYEKVKPVAERIVKWEK